MSTIELTGKRRYRSVKRWGGSFVVLQVEEKYLSTYWNGGTVDSDYVTRWRDAQVSDLTEHERP